MTDDAPNTGHYRKLWGGQWLATCTRCGVAVTDTAAHDVWHSQHLPPLQAAAERLGPDDVLVLTADLDHPDRAILSDVIDHLGLTSRVLVLTPDLQPRIAPRPGHDTTLTTTRTAWVATCYANCQPTGHDTLEDRDLWAARHRRSTGHPVATPPQQETITTVSTPTTGDWWRPIP